MTELIGMDFSFINNVDQFSKWNQHTHRKGMKSIAVAILRLPTSGYTTHHYDSVNHSQSDSDHHVWWSGMSTIFEPFEKMKTNITFIDKLVRAK